MRERAVFLDRDGTLVHARHYPSRPEDLVLYAGIAAGLHRLQAAGFRLIVVTNQSGLARGHFSFADLDRMHAYLRAQLAQRGVVLDGIYYCPHHPEGTVQGLAQSCTCRKPRPGMLLRAAADSGIDLACSWMIGDILDDVEAGNCAGCRTILVDLGTEQSPGSPARTPSLVASDTYHALAMVAAVEGMGPSVDLGYRPLHWPAHAWAVGAR